ncbi:MAG: MFS transporter [Dehalococcoidia bacterium]|nr:MFS transporter [Dehalococcoidia bacterium]
MLPVYARDLGATGVWVGLTFSIFAVTQTIFSPFAGQLSDRFGRKPFIILGLLLYCVAAIGYLTAGSFVQVMIFRALSGIGTAFIFSVARAYMGDMVPPGFEGRWFGMFQTADIVGFGVGPLVAGTIRTVLGFDAVFIAMAMLMASSATIIAVLLPGRPARRAPARRPGEELKAASVWRAARHRLTIGIAWIMMLISVSFGATLSFLAVRLEDDLGTTSFFVGLAFGVEALTAGASQPFLGRVADRVSRRTLVSAGLGLSGGALFAVGTLTAYWPIVGMLMLMGAGVSAAQVSAGAMQVVAGREVAMGTVIGETVGRPGLRRGTGIGCRWAAG